MSSMLNLGLSQKMAQTLKMTPEMRLAVKLLQMNSVELKEQINEVVESNPMIEIDEKRSDTANISIDTLVSSDDENEVEKTEDLKENYSTDWEKYIEDYSNSDYKTYLGVNGNSEDDEDASYEGFVTKQETLRDYLVKQLSELNLTTTESKIGEYIIGLIDKNGYLRFTNEQISEQLKADVSLIEKVRNAMQSMEPTGIGAYDLKECLLLQAKSEGYENDAVTAVIADHLEEVAQNKLVNIAKETGYELDEIKAAVDIIKEFNPKPGASFPTGSDELYVVPEVFIEKIGDDYVPRINSQDVPTLRINKLYKEAILNKDQTTKETYDFIKSKLESAQSFLKFIDKRKETILNVSKAICEIQKDFFEYGILHLKPLTLQDVANIAGIHESTVSRATSGKYAQTPRGLYELKFFFSGAARTMGADDVSTLSVKTRIGELIKRENPKKPLSDNTIVELLKKEGITLARRTVAKYRDELNIPSSSMRKVL